MALGSLGIRRLLDANQTYFQSGKPVYYRYRDLPNIDSTLYQEMGLPLTLPVGVESAPTDLLITPTPGTSSFNARPSSSATGLGEIIRAGVQTFQISHNWVLKTQQLRNFDSPDKVFKDKSVIGFVTDTTLYQINSIQPSEMFGDITDWIVTCNGSDLR